MKPPTWDTVARQVINSTVVAGLAALGMLGGTGAINYRAVAIAFALTFLVEMRHYLGLNGRQ